ncbi:MAG: hypothetical protein PVF56_09960 [Desulfobacterales bacterium]|jgi:hypothetical protein
MAEIPFYSPSPWPSPVKGEGTIGLFTKPSRLNIYGILPFLSTPPYPFSQQQII